MKKIINQKRYDTETATCIGSDSYSTPRDFNHWSETLYQKRTGEFFLYGEGGPMSRYAIATGQNEWSGGEQITPLSFDKARQWAEEHLDADTYESTFGEVTEDGSKTAALFSLSTATTELITRIASVTGMGKSEVIEAAVKDYAEKVKAQ
ncbi:MAG: hypothetical protein ACI4LM_01090 [Anaerovoracaceae bacterium]